MAGFNTMHEAIVYREEFEDVYAIMNNMNEEQANRRMFIREGDGSDRDATVTQQGEATILHLLIDGLYYDGAEEYINVAKMLFNRFNIDTTIENGVGSCAWVHAKACIDGLELDFPNISDDDLQNREEKLNRLIRLIEEHE